MHALNLKTLAIVICVLVVAAVVVHSTVYLSIDPASLSAEMPTTSRSK
jgi:hypothetical protein